MSLRQILVMLLSIAVLAGPLAGCLKGKDDVQEDDVEQKKAEQILGKTGTERVEDAAALIPKNYSFPQQQLLPQVHLSLPGSVDTGALGSYEGQRDEGGIEYRTIFAMQDISQHLPPGQPAELFIKLFWDGREANSADLDIAVNVPGTKTSYSGNSEDFNWNYAVKSLTVNTIGVPGQPHEVGVQIAGGAVAEKFDYRLDIQITYVKDVLAPHHAWAFDVPTGASGVILESEKVTGDEHLTSQFVLIDPNDNLVQFVDFNDIDIPTESVFIPTPTPGTYVFYAYFMHGGFLRMKADVPLETFHVRPLALVESSTVLTNAPAPGVAGKDYAEGLNPAGLADASGIVPDDDVNPTSVAFDLTGSFPLRVAGYVKAQANPMAKLTLSSPKGEVHRLTSIAMYQDESGTIGYTSQREGSTNNLFNWANIQKGAWTAQLVNNGPATEIGYTVLTYTR